MGIPNETDICLGNLLNEGILSLTVSSLSVKLKMKIFGRYLFFPQTLYF